MAKQSGGYLGGFSGKLGTAVGYMWNGKWCLRAHNPMVRNPRTAAQVAHRELFKQEVQLAARMRWVVTKTMTTLAREAGMTSYNLFVKVNQPAFGWEPTASSTADERRSTDSSPLATLGSPSPDSGEERDSGRLAVEWSRLRLSVGDVAPVEVSEVTRTEDNVLKVKYAAGGGGRFDHVYLYAYIPDLGKGYLSAPAYRGDKRISLMLPDHFAGHEAQVYLMVASQDGRWSDSVYCGAVNEGEEWLASLASTSSRTSISSRTSLSSRASTSSRASASSLASMARLDGLSGLAGGGWEPGR